MTRKPVRSRCWKTRFLGYDADGALSSKVISPDGLSVFGLVAHKVIVEQNLQWPEKSDEPLLPPEPEPEQISEPEPQPTAGIAWWVWLIIGIAAIFAWVGYRVWRKRQGGR
jgi:hypothetical protein